MASASYRFAQTRRQTFVPPTASHLYQNRELNFIPKYVNLLYYFLAKADLTAAVRRVCEKGVQGVTSYQVPGLGGAGREPTHSRAPK